MPEWEQVVRDHLGGALARREPFVRELAGHLEEAYEGHLALGHSPAEARARALDAAGDWSALQERIEGEEVEMRARRVIGLAATAALATIVLGGLGWRAALRDSGPLPPIVTSEGRRDVSPEGDAPPPGVGTPETEDREPPRPIEITRPAYPAQAFKAKLEGTVTLLLLIDERGDVAQVDVHQSVPGLDEAAVACAREWKFRPAQHDGHPVPAAAVAPVSFRIY